MPVILQPMRKNIEIKHTETAEINNHHDTKRYKYF